LLINGIKKYPEGRHTDIPALQSSCLTVCKVDILFFLLTWCVFRQPEVGAYDLGSTGQQNTSSEQLTTQNGRHYLTIG